MARNRNEQGIPELCKFDQELERIYDDAPVGGKAEIVRYEAT